MRLPEPPDLREKDLYVRSGRRFVYAAAIPSAIILFIGGVLFSQLHGAFAWYAVFTTIIFVYLTLSYVIGLTGKDFDIRAHSEKVSRSWGKPLPNIDIFLPTCGEPLELLDNTYLGVEALREGQNSVRVYVLDDRGRGEVQKLAEGYGFEYLSRPDRGVMKKAGNLRYAFARTQGEFILILDADFVPRRDMLRELVPYMDDPELAIIQSPQFFSAKSGMTWVERGTIFIQELFYRLVQVSRDHFGAAVCVGSCALYRRKALEPFGGTALIGHSEDVHTGFNVMTAGWKVKYIPVNLAQGVNPDETPQFFTQQYRWAMGSLTLATNPVFWKSNLTKWQKAAFASGQLYYVATGLGVVLNPIPSVMMIWVIPEYVHWYSVACALPSMIYGSIVMARWAHNPWGIFVMRTRHIQGWAHLAALWDKSTGFVAEWAPTGVKASPSGTYVRWKWISTVFSLTLIGVFVGGAWPHLLAGRWEILLPFALLCFHSGLSFFSFRE